MLEWSNCSEVERTPEKLSEARIFKGIHVPVKALFETIEDGASIEDFLAWFPGITKA